MANPNRAEDEDRPVDEPMQERVSKLPAAKVFVVHFTNDTDASLRNCSGRIEHIDSGRRGRFVEIAELLAFIRTILAEMGSRRSE